ncbi:uncharacterized protein N7482_008118 [Penicillium canariense]|uniref:Uncharacterized protein n=1 Tax=Penicillium canariense TaxID=189055 RepID=A0A9W9LI99_9EURO|nr:uncharacterized protein N7482_008118 [Penicillium canariense]KAJ5157018.1 hypothetical protein N7482_008118 [Penicillium canariense]
MADSYATKEQEIPVQDDTQDVEDLMDENFADTDQQLEMDEKEAISRSNIIGGDRTRHAKPQTSNGYNEGPSEEELP